MASALRTYVRPESVQYLDVSMSNYVWWSKMTAGKGPRKDADSFISSSQGLGTKGVRPLEMGTDGHSKGQTKSEALALPKIVYAIALMRWRCDTIVFSLLVSKVRELLMTWLSRRRLLKPFEVPLWWGWLSWVVSVKKKMFFFLWENFLDVIRRKPQNEHCLWEAYSWKIRECLKKMPKHIS